MKTKNNDKFRRHLPVYVGILVLIFAMIYLVRACSDQRGATMRFSRPEGDTLVVAIELSPLSYSMSADTARGLDYEILTDLSRIHRIPMVFRPFSSLSEAYEGLEDGRYDILVASLPTTADLRRRLRLTDGVYLDKQVLVRRRSAVDSDSCVPFPQARLLGDTVWIPEGSPVRGRIDNLARESGGEIYVVEVPKATPEHLTILTALGELRQAVVNESVARHIAADYPDLDISTPLSFNQLQSWAVAPGDSVLADSLDSWLGAFRETPKYKVLLKKYLE